MLTCLRKLFAEARSLSLTELNGEPIFKEDQKNFDGSIQKDVFVSTMLNSEDMALTRIEVSSIVNLLLDINRDDKGKVDVDELHFSY